MEIQKAGAAASFAPVKKPELPDPMATPPKTNPTYTTSDGQKITVLSSGVLGQYTIKIEKADPGFGGVDPKPQIKTVSREELEALISDKKNKNPLKDAVICTMQGKATKPEGVGANLDIAA